MASIVEKTFWQTYKLACNQLNIGWQGAEPALHWAFTHKRDSGYDPKAYGFEGGEFEFLTAKNYEKALRKLWKAEVHAPYLGFKDASKTDAIDAQRFEEDDETKKLVEKITSEAVRKEFEEAYTPEQRMALGRVMSLIGHGEAYALFTSSKLVGVVKGTGPRLGMAMQVMEEAKHFVVMREMLQSLGIDQPPPKAVDIIFERIASAPPHRMMFGMNIVLESIATSLFSQFAESPGLRHVLHQFHMDEARHVGFVRQYKKTGQTPKWVSWSPVEQLQRLLLLLPVIPVLFELRDDLELLGIDAHDFFGSLIFKITRLSEDTGFPLLLPRPYILLLFNAIFNGYVRAYDPDRFEGFVDYCKLKEAPGIPKELFEVEKKLFGLTNEISPAAA